MDVTSFPLPGSAPSVVVAAAPGPGPQHWAGAPTVVLDEDVFVLARRERGADGDVNVIAVSRDGESFDTVAELGPQQFDAAMVERAAPVRVPGGWRLYVSCATPDSKHWWIGAIEAPTLAGLPAAAVRRVFDLGAVAGCKDPVIRRDGDT